MPPVPPAPPPYASSRTPRTSLPSSAHFVPPPNPLLAISATIESVPHGTHHETRRRKSAAPPFSPVLSSQHASPLPSAVRVRFPKSFCPSSTALLSTCPLPASQKNCSPSTQTIPAFLLPAFFSRRISNTPRAASLPKYCVGPPQVSKPLLLPSRLSNPASNSARALPSSTILPLARTAPDASYSPPP